MGKLVAAGLVGLVLGTGLWLPLAYGHDGVEAAQARATAKPFQAYQSGGNCVYIVRGKYADFITAVPVGPGGC